MSSFDKENSTQPAIYCRGRWGGIPLGEAAAAPAAVWVFERSGKAIALPGLAVFRRYSRSTPIPCAPAPHDARRTKMVCFRALSPPNSQPHDQAGGLGCLVTSSHLACPLPTTLPPFKPAGACDPAGILMIAFCRNALVPHVGEVATSSVACGLMGVAGNKGAAAVSLSLYRRCENVPQV